MKVEGNESAAVAFAGAGCGAIDSFALAAPSGAFRISASGLSVGAAIEAADDYSTVARTQSVAVTRTGDRASVTWSVVGSDAACEAAYEDEAEDEDEDEDDYCDPDEDECPSDYCDPDEDECPSDYCDPDEDECPAVPSSQPWETQEVSLGITFLRREVVPIFSRREMSSDARLTLSTKFDDAYDHGKGTKPKCARLSRYKGRCRFSWVIGDSRYQGSFFSTKVVRRRPSNRPDKVVIRSRGSALRTNEHCVVNGGSDCTTRYRIRFH